MDRAKIAYDLHRGGANCAQSLVCAFSDVTGLDQETTMKLCGAFGGGFRTGGICGAVSGAGVVLGFVYPHADPADMPAKTRISKKIMEFASRSGSQASAAGRSGISRQTPQSAPPLSAWA